jgi:hypothetical protein
VAHFRRDAEVSRPRRTLPRMENKSGNFDSQFSQLNAEWVALHESTFKDLQGFSGTLQYSYGARIGFFEKLILLASGTRFPRS